MILDFSGGGNTENTNCLLRQYFPHDTDFNATKEEKLKEVELSLSTRGNGSSTENTNGLLRQHFPRGTSLKSISQGELDES